MPTCGFRYDCPRHYQLAEVNASAALWDLTNTSDAEHLQRLRVAARQSCKLSRKAGTASTKNGQETGSLDSGGWCLESRRAAGLASDAHSTVHLAGGLTYFLPAPHVAADSAIADFLAATLRRCKDPPECRQYIYLSVNDFGAGVGQYGHALLSRDPGYRWRGYDGAGNVESVTNGFVSFFDLTIPLSLPRADWAMSLEVGEHVPNAHERMLIRNLHAHNCRGILLSWAYLGKWGVGHVNNHGNAYLVDTFQQLGYFYNAQKTDELRLGRRSRKVSARNVSRPWFWFARSVLVFERVKPLSGPGCTAIE